jgi:hypothetical protein
MGISQTATAVVVFLTGLLPASCHKTAAPQKAPPASAIATNLVAVRQHIDLGEIVLTNRDLTCVQFSNGGNCTLTPKLLDRKNVHITLELESKDQSGETKTFQVTEIVTPIDKTLEVSLGETDLTFTPHIVEGK